jgi:predicted MFS family arabinose efflux permease
VPLLIDAASFAVLAAIPLIMRFDRVPSGSADGGVSMHEAFAGIRLVFSNPMLRSLLFLVVFFLLALGTINVVEIWFTTSALHAGPKGYGLLGVCMGVGMMATGAMSGRIAARFRRPERLFVAGCVGLCIGIAIFGLSQQLWQACVLLVFLGASNALVNVNAGVLITTHSTDEIRGRVFSAVQGTVSAAQIVALSIGGILLVTIRQPRPIILGGAVASALALALTIAPVLRAGASSLASAEDGGGTEVVATDTLPA